MNAKISVFNICAEAIIHLLLYSLHDCTFKHSKLKKLYVGSIEQESNIGKANRDH